jgi:hypothetical protein
MGTSNRALPVIEILRNMLIIDRDADKPLCFRTVTYLLNSKWHDGIGKVEFTIPMESMNYRKQTAKLHGIMYLQLGPPTLLRRIFLPAPAQSRFRA